MPQIPFPGVAVERLCLLLIIILAILSVLSRNPPMRPRRAFLFISLFFLLSTVAGIFIVSRTISPDLQIRLICSTRIFSGTAYFSVDQSSHVILTGLTATPLATLFHIPLSSLNFCNAKFVWFFFETAGVLTMIWMFFSLWSKLQSFEVALIFYAGFFLLSKFWFIHVDRGQLYLFYALFFFLIYFLNTGSKENAIVSGIIFAILILLRPIAIVAFIPFFLRLRWKFLTGLFAGIVLVMAAYFITGKASVWGEYFYAVKLFSTEMPSLMGIRSFPYLREQLSLVYCPELPAAYYYNATFNPLQYYFVRLGLGNTSPSFFQLAYGVVFVALNLIFLKRTKKWEIDKIFVFAMFLYMTADLFMPFMRGPYNFVQIIPACILLMVKGDRITRLLIISGLLFMHDFPVSFAFHNIIGEIIVLSTMFCFSTGIRFLANNKANNIEA